MRAPPDIGPNPGVGIGADPGLDMERLSRRSLAERGFVWFERLVAGYCLFFGALYWGRIVGYSDMAGWRFDLMPVHWRIVSATLAVFFPFAAIGLWMLASWGPVIWLICAGTELTMHLGLPGLFGESRLTVASHLATIALYAAFRVVIFLQKRARLVSRH